MELELLSWILSLDKLRNLFDGFLLLAYTFLELLLDSELLQKGKLQSELYSKHVHALAYSIITNTYKHLKYSQIQTRTPTCLINNYKNIQALEVLTNYKRVHPLVCNQ